VGVAGHAQTQVARSGHNGPDFLFRILGAGAVLAQIEHAASAGNLDEVGPALELFAHGLAALVGPVGEVYGATGLHHLVFVEAVGFVHVAAGGRNGHARRVDARARHQALGHGFAQAGVHARAAAVAHRGEAGAQRGQGVALGPVGHVGRVEGEALAEAVAAGARLEVHVGVNQAGQHGAIFQVDDPVLGAGGGRVAALHGRDAVFFYNNSLLGEQLAAAHVQQAAAVQVGFLGESSRSGQQQRGRGQCVNRFARHTVRSEMVSLTLYYVQIAPLKRQTHHLPISPLTT